MAAALLRGMLGDEWLVDSAGLRAGRGFPATDGAVQALRKFGVDLGWHRSKPIEDIPLDLYHLVLVMTAQHKQDLLVRMPGLRGRVYQLSEMAGELKDIGDPFGEGTTVYIETAREIRDMLMRGKACILELSTKF